MYFLWITVSVCKLVLIEYLHIAHKHLNMRLILILIALLICFQDVLSFHGNELVKSNDDDNAVGFYAKGESKRSASRSLDQGFFAEFLSSVSYKEEEQLKIYKQSKKCLKQLFLVYKQIVYVMKRRIIDEVQKMQNEEVSSVDLELYLSLKELNKFYGYLEQFETYASSEEPEESLSQQAITFCDNLEHLEAEVYQLIDRMRIRKTKKKSMTEIIVKWIPTFDRRQIVTMLPMVIFIVFQLTILVYCFSMLSIRNSIILLLANLVFSTSLVQYHFKCQLEHEQEWLRRNRVLSDQCSSWLLSYFVSDCHLDDYQLQSAKHDTLVHFLMNFLASLFLVPFEHMFGFIDQKLENYLIFRLVKPILVLPILAFLLLIYSKYLLVGISLVQRLIFGSFDLSPTEASHEERSQPIHRLEPSPSLSPNSVVYYIQKANFNLQQGSPEFQSSLLGSNYLNFTDDEDYFSAQED